MYYRRAVRVVAALAPIALDQRIGGAVVGQRVAYRRGFQLGSSALRQRLAQLHAPLVERIDVPDHALVKTLCS